MTAHPTADVFRFDANTDLHRRATGVVYIGFKRHQLSDANGLLEGDLVNTQRHTIQT